MQFCIVLILILLEYALWDAASFTEREMKAMS